MIEGKKISKLDPITNLQEGCCFPVLSRGATKRITFASLINNIMAKLPDASQEEIEEIKESIKRLETQVKALGIDKEELENLLKEIDFTIRGQNATIEKYVEIVRNFEEQIGGLDIAKIIANKADRSELPTKTSDLENDSGFITAEDVPSPEDKMDKNNPVGTGSFSMNRKADTTIGQYSHAEGASTEASGQASHSEGTDTKATNYNSHAEGSGTKATGESSHAEGVGTKAEGTGSHSEGKETTASGEFSHAEGFTTTANGDYSHAQGFTTTASGDYSHAQGSSTKAEGDFSHAEGSGTKATGDLSHAKGQNTIASGRASYAEGDTTKAIGDFSHAEGDRTEAIEESSHSEGKETKASGKYSHSEGVSTNANKEGSHAEGFTTTANGDYSHSEGGETTASGDYSHAEGSSTKAEADSSHAEGNGSFATGASSHAEGFSTRASNGSAHSEGSNTTASGYDSHAEGYFTKASGWASHSEGIETIASGDFSHVQGKFNVEDTENKFADIIGNGSSINERSNASATDWEGNQYLKGILKVNCNADSSGGEEVAVKDDLNSYVEKSRVANVVESGNNNPVSSNAVNIALANYQTAKENILTSSVDLNTLNTVGRYFAKTDDVGNGCSNKPVENIYSFYLEVVQTPNGTTHQIMYTGTGVRYNRVSYDFGNTWNPWR